jgi:D-arabinose 1-dehydrogenase-like Zn-dependent alcohol dehydrogenase
MGMEVVAFSSTESKKDEALKFGAQEFIATKGLTKFENIKPVDALLITAGVQPDFAL